MKFAVVLAQVIGPHVNGSQVACWAVVRHLLREGHEVHVCSIIEREGLEGQREQITNLERTGARFSPIVFDRVQSNGSSPGRRVGFREKCKNILCLGPVEDHVPSLKFRSLAEAKLRQIAPDGILCYDVHSLSATLGSRVAPRLGIVVDLWHRDILLHWNVRKKAESWLTRLKLGIRTRRSAKLHKEVMLRIVSDCDRKIEFAYHHAQWFRDNGIKDMIYLPTPVEDPLIDVQRSANASTRESKPTILLIGDLTNISTRLGMELFADEILGELDRRLGREGFRARVVGGGRLPQRIHDKLSGHPSVSFVGRVSPPHQEFLSADVVLVPTPVEIGMRVRIAVAFGYGCCVVTHAANGAGIPEMKHNQNALVGASGAEIARLVELACKDRKIAQEVGRNARATFVEYFSAEKAARRLTDELLEIARARDKGRALAGCTAAAI